MKDSKEGTMRTLKVRILRIKPGEESNARYQEYTVEEKPRMSVLLLLDEIKETQDSTIYYEAVCRSSICGSCALWVNGQPKLACKTQIKDLPAKITLAPLPNFPLIKDLAVDKSKFFAELNRKLEAWVHACEEFKGEESIMSDEMANKLYERERCIECGICVSACPAGNFTPFMAATGCGHGLRFALDPRNTDKKAVKCLISALASDEGLWGCDGVGACQKFCPKELQLIPQMAETRKEILCLIIVDWLKKLGLNKAADQIEKISKKIKF